LAGLPFGLHGEQKDEGELAISKTNCLYGYHEQD
jgi:hypothetical protein